MKHFVGDGRGLREVWLDGFKLERVIECDDELMTATIMQQPVRVQYPGDNVATEVWQGLHLIVQAI